MKVMICGSLAYDTIMEFEGAFENHILKDEINRLNVAFLAPKMRREFGGCAGNIAYNLKMLGVEPTIMASAGRDFSSYEHHLKNLDIDISHVEILKDEYTAQAFITTDINGNQLTVFHPGAMSYSQINSVSMVNDISLGVVSPDGREGMLKHANEFYDRKIPFLFDPGQGLPMFDKKELLDFIQKATYVVTNDYEAKMLVEKTGESIDSIAKCVKAFVVTNGGLGSDIYANGVCEKIQAVEVENATDPTGCGDAYRAGLIHGILEDFNWTKTGRLASLIGSIKVRSQGPQNHTFDFSSISDHYHSLFGESL